MPEQKDRIVYLICKHFREELSPEEKEELEAWLSEKEEHRELLTQYSDDNMMVIKTISFGHSEIPDAWAKVRQRMNAREPVVVKIDSQKKKTLWSWIAAAVVIIVITGITLYVMKNKSSNDPDNATTITQPKQLSSQPIKEAEITLIDGSKVLLENMKDDSSIKQGAYSIFKRNNDLYYQNNKTIPFSEDSFNTITTPPGCQLRVFLPDNSIVIMNVASSLKFNVSDSIRKVYLNGESEFNITRNPDKPFLAIISKEANNGIEGKIEVLGTRFNINAYKDENIKKISLLEGHVNVSTTANSNKMQQLTKAGQQAQLQENGSIDIIQQVDTSAVVSWKAGIVHFNKTSAQQAFNTLEKWYNVKVINKDIKMPACAFSGKITPRSNITTVLMTMQAQCNELHCSFDSTTRTIAMQP